MKPEDIIITRKYKCSNCNSSFTINQTASEDFLKWCDVCKKDELVMKWGKWGDAATFVDMENPKSVGMTAQKNTERREKEEGIAPKESHKRNNYFQKLFKDLL